MRWEQRSVEIANLLNPAFCAVLLRDAIYAYTQKDARGMNYLLIYLVLPLVLHTKTRSLIPNRTSQSLIEWVEQNKINDMMTVERIRQMNTYTREGILWGISQGIIKFNSEIGNYAHLVPTSKDVPNEESWLPNTVPFECRHKSKIIGTWFAELAEPTTIYRSLNIRP